MIIEGLSTGFRTFAPGALTWREPPFAFRWQETEPEMGGHALAVHVGNVARVERQGNELWGYGPLDLDSEEGLEFARKLALGFARWVSIGLDEQPVDVEVVMPADAPDGDGLEALLVEPEQLIIHSGRIGELTAVTVPALAEAFVEATPELLDELRARGVLPAQDGPETIAAAAHTITIPDVPPAEWFDEPADEPLIGGLNVTDDGRVHGYLAPFGVAHRAFRRHGETVYAPRGNVDFAKFLNKTALVMGTDGQVERIAAGNITMECGHAPVSAAARRNPRMAPDHYDNSCSVAARIRVGENEHGVWVAGALVSDVTPAQIERMLACELSGDWQSHETKPGWTELTAALLVPVGGFPRAQANTSIRVRDGQLVASAVPVRYDGACGCPAPLAASAAPDLSRVKARIVRPIMESRKAAAAARVRG
jgi:hypothetical protein